MIISMKLHSTREEVDEVRKQVEHFGYKVHSIEGEERVVIGVVGVGDVTACLESVEAMPQVEKVVPITAPYKFVSKEFRKGKTRIKINGTDMHLKANGGKTTSGTVTLAKGTYDFECTVPGHAAQGMKGTVVVS